MSDISLHFVDQRCFSVRKHYGCNFLEDECLVQNLCFVDIQLCCFHTIVLMFLVMSRFMTVVHPMTTKFKRSSFVFKCIACLVGFGCSISLSVGLTAALTMLEIPNSVCSPFADPRKSATVIIVIVVFICVTQSCSGFLIALLHVMFLYKLTKSQQSVSKTGTNKNTALVTQVSLLTLCPILCWCTTNAENITILFMSKFPVELIEWNIVMVIPLCPLLTSSILTCKHLVKHWQSKL